MPVENLNFVASFFNSNIQKALTGGYPHDPFK